MSRSAEVTNKTSEYDFRVDQWRKIRDALEGQDQVRAKREQYLPRPRGQDLADYDFYLRRAVFYSVSDRTARGLTGLVFRVAPTIELPERLEFLREAASPDGFPIETMVRNATRELITIGRHGLLVDLPQRPMIGAEVRPFLSSYNAESIWRWDERFDPLQGTRVLTRVVLEEQPTIRDGEEITHLRELFLDVVAEDEGGQPTAVEYRQQLWESRDAESESRRPRSANQSPITDDEILELEDFVEVGDPITPLMNGAPLDFIPFTFVNTYDLLPRTEKPPMLDLVNVNVAHYRNSADYEHLLHLVGSPTPWVSANWEDSDDQKPSAIGAGTRWLLPPGAKVGMLEFSGSSAQALERAMERKEEQMASLGARLIQDQERSNVAAETKRMQAEGQVSVLASAVGTAESGFERALRIAAEWAGANPDDVDVALNHDFIDSRLSPNELKELVKSWHSGAFSRRTLHENLQRGEIIDPKRTLEEELELIQGEAPDEPPGLEGEPEEE